MKQGAIIVARDAVLKEGNENYAIVQFVLKCFFKIFGNFSDVDARRIDSKRLK